MCQAIIGPSPEEEAIADTMYFLLCRNRWLLLSPGMQEDNPTPEETRRLLAQLEHSLANLSPADQAARAEALRRMAEDEPEQPRC